MRCRDLRSIRVMVGARVDVMLYYTCVVALHYASVRWIASSGRTDVGIHSAIIDEPPPFHHLVRYVICCLAVRYIRSYSQHIPYDIRLCSVLQCCIVLCWRIDIMLQDTPSHRNTHQCSALYYDVLRDTALYVRPLRCVTLPCFGLRHFGDVRITSGRSTTHHKIMHYIRLHHNMLHYNALPRTVRQRHTILHVATHTTTTQHNTSCYITRHGIRYSTSHSITLHDIALPCSTLH